MFQRQTFSILAALVFMTTGCQHTMDLDLEDRDSLSPGGRISYEIYPGIDTRREGSLLGLVRGTPETQAEGPATVWDAGIRPTISIDGEVAQVRGHDHQQVPEGRVVGIDTLVEGPARVGLRADNVRINMTGRGGVRFFDVLSLEGILGVGIDRTEMNLRGGGVSSTRNEAVAGFLYGGRATLSPVPLFDLYAQYTENVSAFQVTTQDLQAGLELNLTRNVAVYGGFRWFDYESKNFNDGSDVELDSSGPMVGVSLKF